MEIGKPTARFQEIDGAAKIAVRLAKFRKESGAFFLGLGINGGCSRNRKENPKSDEQAINWGDGWGVFLGLGVGSSSNHGRALNPNPLRSYHPTQGYRDYASSSSSSSSSRTRCAGKKRMREEKDQSKGKKGGGGPKRSRVGEFQYPDPVDPPPELVQIIRPNVRPVFLYRKQLSEWDTREDQNRLFVNDRKKLMDFMTEEERLAVEDPEKPGIDLVGIDSLGGVYELHSNLWASLDKVVVNKGWYTILAANGAEKGDWVHLWAFRPRDAAQFCLYVDFRHQP